MSEKLGSWEVTKTGGSIPKGGTGCIRCISSRFGSGQQQLYIGKIFEENCEKVVKLLEICYGNEIQDENW